MLAQQSQILKEAVETVYDLTADEAIREQCKAREKHIMEMKTLVKEKEIALAKLEQSEQQNEQLSQQNKQLSQQNEQLSQQIKQLSQQLDQVLQGIK